MIQKVVIGSIRMNLKGDMQAMIDVFSGMDSKPKIYLCLPATCYIEKGSIKDSVIVHGVIPRIREVAEKKPP